MTGSSARSSAYAGKGSSSLNGSYPWWTGHPCWGETGVSVVCDTGTPSSSSAVTRSSLSSHDRGHNDRLSVGGSDLAADLGREGRRSTGGHRVTAAAIRPATPWSAGR